MVETVTPGPVVISACTRKMPRFLLALSIGAVAMPLLFVDTVGAGPVVKVALGLVRSLGGRTRKVTATPLSKLPYASNTVALKAGAKPFAPTVALPLLLVTSVIVAGSPGVFVSWILFVSPPGAD